VEVEKGQLLFVEAAKLVAKQFPDSRFVIVGSPMFSNRTYHSKVVVAAAGLPVEFVDWQDDMVNVYSDLDLLVVPSSTAEATTRVIPEAFSARVPVVAFPAGGIPEVLQDNKTGFLAFGTTAKALAARIISLLRMDAVELETVVEEARYTWERRFTLRAYQDSVCDALSDAMHGFSTFQLTPTRQSVLCR
jgi:glycosyltransferase involved in cell wall biosynthesis